MAARARIIHHGPPFRRLGPDKSVNVSVADHEEVATLRGGRCSVYIPVATFASQRGEVIA